MYRLLAPILATSVCTAMAGAGLAAGPTVTVASETAVWATTASSAHRRRPTMSSTG